ncbi:MAG: Dabb family protein [Candidatus Hydrogenedentes bacterium]|nr:Dabb family protein [Candidatus Hydrogenedentota bacterium]
MLLHSVYFWLRQDLNEDERNQFCQGLVKLRRISSVVDLYVGKPAKTEKRQIIDDSYTYGLIVLFNDVKGHDEYQSHPIHKEFLASFSSFWSKVLVYDIQV